MHRNKLQVVFRLNPRNRTGKPELEPHQHRQHQCHQADGDGCHSILDRDDLVILAPYILPDPGLRSEEHTSELQSLMRISYAVFCLKKKNNTPYQTIYIPLNIKSLT